MPTIEADDGKAAPFAPLVTKRLELRPFELDDLDQFHHQAGNAEVARQTLNFPYPLDQETARHWLLATRQDHADGLGPTLAIERRRYKGLIGAIGLNLDPAGAAEGELGYWIARTYWGNGFGVEAARRMVRFGFEDLGLKRIWACTFADNPASQNVLLNIGMKPTGAETVCAEGREAGRAVHDFEILLAVEPGE